MFGLFVAMFTLAGFYIHLHHREVLDDLGHVATLLGLAVAAVVLCMFAAGDAWRAEILPLLVFAMTVAIAYDEDLSLLLSAEVALVVVVGLGRGLADYVTLVAAAAAMIFWMGRIRSRSKLIYVGLWAGAVVLATQIGAHLLEDDKGFVERAASHVGQRDHLNDILLCQPFEEFVIHHLAECIQERPQIGIDLSLQIPRKKSEVLTRFYSWPDEHNFLNLLGPQSRYRHCDCQECLAAPGGASTEHDIVFSNRRDVRRLSGGARHHLPAGPLHLNGIVVHVRLVACCHG